MAEDIWSDPFDFIPPGSETVTYFCGDCTTGHKRRKWLLHAGDAPMDTAGSGIYSSEGTTRKNRRTHSSARVNLPKARKWQRPVTLISFCGSGAWKNGGVLYRVYFPDSRSGVSINQKPLPCYYGRIYWPCYTAAKIDIRLHQFLSMAGGLRECLAMAGLRAEKGEDYYC